MRVSQRTSSYNTFLGNNFHLVWLGSYVDVKLNSLKGYIRISNAVLTNIGGDSSNCGIHLANSASSSNVSYLINSSLSGGIYGTVCVDNTLPLVIQNNVMHHIGGRHPLRVKGNNNIVTKNLIIAAGGSSSCEYLSDSIVAEDNFMIGSDFFFKGDACPDMASSLPLVSIYF